MLLRYDNKPKTKVNTITLFYLLFWIFGIIPKGFQLVLFTILAGFIIIKNGYYIRLKPTKAMFFLLTGICIQVIAIVWQLIVHEVDVSRTLASINTVSIWLVGVFFYQYFYTISINKEYLINIYKIVLFNLLILTLIYIFSLIYKDTSLFILNYSLPLRHKDYMIGGGGYRFSGLLETQLAVSHMFLIFLPLLTLPPNNKKLKKITLVVASFALITVLASHSRMGIISAICCYLAFFWIIVFTDRFKKYDRMIILFSLIMGGIIVMLVKWTTLVKIASNFIYSRAGSNSARTYIYRESIKKVLSENPLFGIGIKYFIGFSWADIPYGSHSTYIGLLYKAGIIGCIIYIIGFFFLLRRIWYINKDLTIGYPLMIMILSYFLFLAFADIDGINWVCIYAFATFGILSNNAYRKCQLSR